MAYYVKGDAIRAISDFNELLNAKSGGWTIYWYRGKAYESTRDYDRAIADFTHVIEARPDSSAAYLQRGLAYKNKGNRSKAVDDLKEVTKHAATAEQKESAVRSLRQLGVRA